MSLHRLERQLLWPSATPVSQLRQLIRTELSGDGELLRWAITSVRPAATGDRWLGLEAVVQR